jgi:hypothetical protein
VRLPSLQPRQRIHPREVISLQYPPNFSITSLDLDPPLFYAIVNDHRSAIPEAPFSASLADERAIVFLVPRAFRPNVGEALADIHVTQNDVSRRHRQVCDCFLHQNPVRLPRDVDTSKAGDLGVGFQFPNLMPAFLPGRIQDGFLGHRPRAEGAALERTCILVNHGQLRFFGIVSAIYVALLRRCRSGCNQE